MLELTFAANLAVTLSISTVLLSLILWKRMLTVPGAFVSFAIGVVIGIFGGVAWLAMLLLLLFSSIVSTRYKFALKKRLGVQEGKAGERGTVSVLANGGTAAVAAILSSPWVGILDPTVGAVVFTSAIAVAGADTMASEIGVLARHPRLITTFEVVRPGTDGGISLLGTTAALLASLYISVLGYVLLSWGDPVYYLFIPFMLGFAGCQLDSIIGATVETAGYITKSGNNLVSITTGAAAAWLWMIL